MSRKKQWPLSLKKLKSFFPNGQQATIQMQPSKDLKNFLKKKRQWEEDSQKGPEMKFKTTTKR